MKSRFDPEKHRRRSIRLKGYDYSSNGAYYVTIVTQGREHLFGKISENNMILNEAGQMIYKWWNELPNKFPNIVLGESIVMPNHFHCIIIIAGADLRVRPDGDENNKQIGCPNKDQTHRYPKSFNGSKQ